MSSNSSGILNLGNYLVLTLFNKVDQVEDIELAQQLVGKEGILVSALHPETLREFLVQAERLIGKVLDKEGLRQDGNLGQQIET